MVDIDNRKTYLQRTNNESKHDEKAVKDGRKMYISANDARNCLCLTIENTDGSFAIPYMHLRCCHYDKAVITLDYTTGIQIRIHGKNIKELSKKIALFKMEFMRCATYGEDDKDFDIFIDAIEVRGVDNSAVINDNTATA